VATCQRLTELTIIYPHLHNTSLWKTGDPLDTVELAHSATLKLIKACKALPDFDTIQIVYFLSGHVLLRRRHVDLLSSEQVSRALREQVKGVTDLAINCLKEPGPGCREGEGRKTTVRVIELSPDHPGPQPYLGPVKVEEYEA